ncbi:unnamed protein product [Fusarium graminearum]|nr:unnamed protein product [Fusarium graminearum]CAG1984574.1 unnamed protein product [Fusarium graminearum]VTO88228.1 unnamed protein product [Fusarium graminearum]
MVLELLCQHNNLSSPCPSHKWFPGLPPQLMALPYLLPLIGIAIKMPSRSRHKIQSMPQYRGGQIRASPAP